ncbi:hypothetical protein ACHAWO_002694 [Cyclotella atomus]|uniref:Uncharacterized protein n=1 Tax=Cyclotella atomus TaxID=382360 RepID=A0ABD3NP99_9STRA
MAFFGGGYYSGSDGYDSDEDGYGGCACGMCGPNPFAMMLMGGLFWGIGVGGARNPWRNRREKSGAAQGREDVARNKFNQIKETVDEVLQEKLKVTVKLGCRPKSESLLKSLPGILIEDICQFAGLPQAKPRPRVAAAAAAGNVPSTDHIVRSTGRGRSDVNLSDFGIYRPGEKITIPLTSPAEHLTGPCWRGTYVMMFHVTTYRGTFTFSHPIYPCIVPDFSKAVRRNDGWDVKRVAATDQQKKAFREARKGKVYFVDVIYTVPGGKVSKRRVKKTSTSAAAPAAKKAKTGAPSAVKKTNPEDARRALSAAIESGVSSTTGEVNDESLQLAINGYLTIFFILACCQAAPRLTGKPAAKR